MNVEEAHKPELHLYAADSNHTIISGKAPEKHNLARESAWKEDERE